MRTAGWRWRKRRGSRRRREAATPAAASPACSILAIAKAERDTALAKLRKAQTESGGFPWWPGGPPSTYMTIYILHGFANLLEFGGEVPRDMVLKAWQNAGKDIRRDLDLCMSTEHDCPFVTFVNYTLSSYPDESWYKPAFDEAYRKVLLDYSFSHWKEHSPYLKGELALTLKRMGRAADARLVWDSVMDSSKTDRDLGTYWAPEDRSWLWYNDTIETQAFALRTLDELEPADSRRAGLVQWLMLNKKLNQWKSTRATAEVIYSLAHYLKKEGALGIREDATVTVAGQKTSFVFEPDRYTGKKNQIVISGEKIDPKTASTVSRRKAGKGTGVRLGDLAFLDREASGGGSRRLLRSLAALLPARVDGAGLRLEAAP